MYFSGQEVVGVGVVHPRGRDVVELLARTGLRLGYVDDVQDLGTAEAGDLHGTHACEARAGCGALPVTGRAMLCGPRCRPGRGADDVLEARDDGRDACSGG
jgi:hypothetical protein